MNIPTDLHQKAITIRTDRLGIVFYRHDQEIYDLPWSSLRTPASIIEAMQHLARKSWVDTDTLATFTTIAFEQQESLKNKNSN